MNVYVIGSSPAPDWCADRLMQFQKMDGTIGFEFRGTIQDIILEKGDKLIKNGQRIEVRRMKHEG